MPMGAGGTKVEHSRAQVSLADEVFAGILGLACQAALVVKGPPTDAGDAGAVGLIPGWGSGLS